MKRITALLLTAALLLTCTACTQAGKANLGLTAEARNGLHGQVKCRSLR